MEDSPSMEEAYKKVKTILSSYSIVDQDLHRPWGGFYRICDDQASRFIGEFFPDINLKTHLPISPKILIVKPHQRLSWQYHHRREEIWSILQGPVAMVRSPTDDMKDQILLEENDLIVVECKERHRLIGLEEPAIIAELWRHIDKDHPSNEKDIVRVQDDYRRN